MVTDEDQEIDDGLFYPHAFETAIVPHNVGSYRYTVVFLDGALVPQLPLDRYPRLRVSGEIGDVPFEGTFQPVRGRWYIMLNKQLMSDGGFAIGDVVEVRFRVEDQDAVDVPAELLERIARDVSLQRAWQDLSPGKQRGVAYHVRSAKTAATRAKRLEECIVAITERGGDLRKPRQG